MNTVLTESYEIINPELVLGEGVRHNIQLTFLMEKYGRSIAEKIFNNVFNNVLKAFIDNPEPEKNIAFTVCAYELPKREQD